jgi:hypothetical protein
MHDALAWQRAEGRRGAPGKAFVGDTAAQSLADRRAQLERVGEMAARDAAEKRAEALGVPLTTLLLDLAGDTLQLARTLASAPFRIAGAVLRPRTA